MIIIAVRIEMEKIEAPIILILTGLGLVSMLCLISLAVELVAKAVDEIITTWLTKIRAEKVKIAHHLRAFVFFI